MTKIEDNKEEKKRKILEASFSLFTEKGFKDTSIQEIVDKAKVAKGTFYLYFEDKYDVYEYLITKKSKQLFEDAILYVDKENITEFKERFTAIIDYIINQFILDKSLLKFISKNLSLGVFGDKLTSFMDKENGFIVLDEFERQIKINNVPIKNPKLTLFMVIELTSSVVFTSISLNKPLPIEELKPYLYENIKKILFD